MTPMDLPPAAHELALKIRRREARIAVLGLGYVGLPLALAFAENGFDVLGFDTDEAKVSTLARGESYIADVSPEPIAAAVADRRLEATADFGRLAEGDALLICVPTPLDESRRPDLGYVESTARAIADRLRPGQLVALESTTWPGTTEEVLKPILETSGLACGREVFLAFSPERVDPGSRVEVRTIPKVVGGVDEVSGQIAETLYGAVFTSVVRLSTSRAAEASKLCENVFRAVNIALVNELKTIYAAMDVDIWEVLEAADTKPFGFMRFNPGPGWGGHCIPIDPFYLSWKAGEMGIRTRFVELAGEINREMPAWVLDRLEEALAERGQTLAGASILVLGLAYKKDVADPRESPAFEILHRLLKKGAQVGYHDPYVPEAPAMRSWPELPPLRSLPLDDDVLDAQDAVVVVTDHGSVDYERVRERSRLVVDTRGVYRRPAANVVSA